MKTSKAYMIALVSTIMLSISVPITSFATDNEIFDHACRVAGGTPEQDAFGNLWCDYDTGESISCDVTMDNCEIFVMEMSNNRVDDGGGVIVQRTTALDVMQRFITPLIAKDLLRNNLK
ncbi:MAG: hypothetical protein GY797_28180 [Deltaproteobacteria bacterium]|nr:hypothetical protein [Deltaproteobacteria bacterium]